MCLGVSGDVTSSGVLYHRRSVVTLLECRQSLYTLKMRMVQKSPQICIPVMSGELILNSVKFEVASVGITSMTALIFASFLYFSGGYTVLHPLGVRVVLS